MLNDKQILERCTSDKAMISPFVPMLVSQVNDARIVSYGLSSAGYDVRLGTMFAKFATNGIGDPHDPKADGVMHHTQVDAFVIQPKEHVLGVTVEEFAMPDDVVGICLGKSTYARLGLIVNVTPLEPGWCGYLTLELHNASRRMIKVYPNEGIAQITFHKIERPRVTYEDRHGKYQHQVNIPVRSKL